MQSLLYWLRSASYTGSGARVPLRLSQSWLRSPEKAPSLIVQVLSMRSESSTLPCTSENTRQLSLGPDA